MIAAVICAIATCLVMEGTARQCDASPDAVVIHKRELTYADVADLSSTLIDSVEMQACRRISVELAYPTNHRLTDRWLERPQTQTAEERK